MTFTRLISLFFLHVSVTIGKEMFFWIQNSILKAYKRAKKAHQEAERRRKEAEKKEA